MPSPYPFPSLLPFERPRCQRCQAQMQLRSIQPAEKGFEFRTFECGTCDSQQTVTAVADPIQTDKAGSSAGELRPPE